MAKATKAVRKTPTKTLKKTAAKPAAKKTAGPAKTKPNTAPAKADAKAPVAAFKKGDKALMKTKKGTTLEVEIIKRVAGSLDSVMAASELRTRLGGKYRLRKVSVAQRIGEVSYLVAAKRGDAPNAKKLDLLWPLASQLSPVKA